MSSAPIVPSACFVLTGPARRVPLLRRACLPSIHCGRVLEGCSIRRAWRVVDLELSIELQNSACARGEVQRYLDIATDICSDRHEGGRINNVWTAVRTIMTVCEGLTHQRWTVRPLQHRESRWWISHCHFPCPQTRPPTTSSHSCRPKSFPACRCVLP